MVVLDVVVVVVEAVFAPGADNANGVSMLIMGSDVSCDRVMDTPPLLTQPMLPADVMPRTQLPLESRPSSKIVVPRASPLILE